MSLENNETKAVDHKQILGQFFDATKTREKLLANDSFNNAEIDIIISAMMKIDEAKHLLLTTFDMEKGDDRVRIATQLFFGLKNGDKQKDADNVTEDLSLGFQAVKHRDLKSMIESTIETISPFALMSMLGGFGCRGNSTRKQSEEKTSE